MWYLPAKLSLAAARRDHAGDRCGVSTLPNHEAELTVGDDHNIITTYHHH
jgi:hypothetical protein